MRFNSFIDSARIHFLLLRYTFFSFVSTLIDFSLFYLVYALSEKIFLATVLGRVVSGSCNFMLNKHYAFKDSGKILHTGIKYALWASVMALLSYSFIKLLHHTGHSVYWAKIWVEGFLYIFNFFMQRRVIFSGKKIE